MGSWIKCVCGNLLHKNLASGAGIVFLVPEDVLEMDVEDLSTRELLATLVLRADRAVRCETCGRIAVERKGGAIEFFAKEPITGQ